jgi:hypothetical protein
MEARECGCPSEIELHPDEQRASVTARQKQ